MIGHYPLHKVKPSHMDPFSYASNGWFDSEWMFGVNGGFDIAIANLPYGFRNVLSKKNEKAYFRKGQGIQFPSGDVAELFIILTLDKLVSQREAVLHLLFQKNLFMENHGEM